MTEGKSDNKNYDGESGPGGLVIPELFPSCQGGVRGGLYRESSDFETER